MSNEYLKHIDLTKAGEKIDHYTERCLFTTTILDQVLPILETFEGKKITRRMSNKIKEVLDLDMLHVYYKSELTFYEVSIQSKTNRDLYMSIYLGRLPAIYNSEDGVFTMENYRDMNVAYLLDYKRLKAYQEYRGSNFGLYVEEYNQIITALKELTEREQKLFGGIAKKHGLNDFDSSPMHYEYDMEQRSNKSEAIYVK